MSIIDRKFTDDDTLLERIDAKTGLPKKVEVSEQELDDKFGELAKPEHIAVSQQKAEDYVKENKWTPEHIRELRKLAKHELFFLATSVLGFNLLSPNLHGHLCKWLKANQATKYKMILLPRDHYKSTIVTVSETIQKILPEDLENFPYPFNLGTDGRWLICHEASTKASTFLYQITNHFTSNPIMMALFPECVPDGRKHKINRTELELPRTKFWSEPTISAMGTGARSQGSHYDDALFDDIIGEAARDSETEMNSSKDWFDSTPGFRVSLKKSTFTVVGTRWSSDDTYDHILTRYKPVGIKVYRRAIEEPVIEDGKEVKKPIFPEIVDSDVLTVLKQNKKVFASQYMNDPEGGSNAFEEQWIRQFWWDGDFRLVIPADREAGRPIRETYNLWDCYRVMLVDPAISGNMGWCVTATTPTNKHFIVEARQDSYTIPNQANLFFEMARKYQIHTLAIESDMFMALYEEWLKREMTLRGQMFHITPVDTEKKSKPMRVHGLANYLMAGQILINDSRYSKGQDKLDRYSDLEYQMRKFPSIKDYHVLDSLAYGPKVWRPGFAQNSTSDRNKAATDKLAGRSSVTGYSKINYAKR